MNRSSHRSSRGWESIWAGETAFADYWNTPDPAVLEWASHLDSDFLLDLGCGVGRHTASLMEMGLKVIGGDISTSGLASCANKMRRMGKRQLLACHDITHLPFASSAFGALLAFNVIYHTTLGGMHAVVAEIERVLRPGALLYLTMIGRVEENIASFRKDVEKGVCAEIEPFTFIYLEHAYEDKYLPHHYSDLEEIQHLLAGFEIESLIPVRNEFTDENGIRHVSLHHHVVASAISN